jgi:hypothetical protein
VDDRLEDRTLWYCFLCQEEATPAHCCGHKHRSALAACCKDWDSLPNDLTAEWDPGFDAQGSVLRTRLSIPQAACPCPQPRAGRTPALLL